jgi:hypothetical protein
LRSATPQCGKTRLLRLIAALSNGNPKVMTCPTAAVLFRCGRKVLVIDEVDRLRNQDKDSFGAILSVLNSGFEKGGEIERNERVSKSEGKAVSDGYELRSYSVYGPKAFAGIERLADTLADRTFSIQMSRTPTRMPRLNMRLMEAIFDDLRANLTAWFNDNNINIQKAYQELPDVVPQLSSYDDRFQDISEPLYVLATVADAERGHKAILPRLFEGLAVVSERRMRSERERAVVALLQYVDCEMKQSEQMFIQTQTLLDHCRQVFDLAWITSGAALADFLSNFELSPARNSTGDRRGYTFTRDWVDRLLHSYSGRQIQAPVLPITPMQSVNVSEIGSYSSGSPCPQVSEH